AAGGIHGRKIVYVKEDDECLPAKGVGAVKKLIHEHQPFMIVGGGCSNAAIAQKPEVLAAKIPWVIVASTADSLTEPTDPHIYSSMSTAWSEVYGMLQYALDEKKSKIAIVWQNDAWGKARIEPLKQAFASKKVTPAAIEEIAVEPSDATPIALKLKALNPDAVILLTFPKAAVPYVRDAMKVGFQPLTVGGSPLVELDQIAKGAGGENAVKTMRVVAAPGYGVDDPKMAQWKEKIEKRFGDRFNLYHMFGLSAGQFAVEALKRAGKDLTRARIMEVMSTLEMQTDSYAGPLKCTPQDHQCHKTLGIFALANGRVSGVGKTTPTR
ncbi:MAG: ABC transporter substrate-binding protein, partial [Alphaproteobacteria bacterium]|nr:ABC transporter substrate-binding protein [Alphaproteobacteria bacterium]